MEGYSSARLWCILRDRWNSVVLDVYFGFIHHPSTTFDVRHLITRHDIAFARQVESFKYPVPRFDHRAHVRLAYIYLVQHNNTGVVVHLVRKVLTGLLAHTGIDPAVKYHETLTEAWILAVDHFLNITEDADSADDFIGQHPEVLGSKIMLTHYSPEILFSEKARKTFVEPDLQPIPRLTPKLA